MSTRRVARRASIVLAATVIMVLCVAGTALAQGSSPNDSAAVPQVGAQVGNVDGGEVSPDISYWGTIWSTSISQSTANKIGNAIASGTGIAGAIGACVPDAGPFIGVVVAVGGTALAYDFRHYAPGGIVIKVQQCHIAPLLRCTFDGATIISVPE